VGFAAKPQLAWRMIERALRAKVPFAWFAADEAYGDNGPLRAQLEGHRIGYVLAVSRDHRVPAGAGRTIRADKLATRLPARAWQRAAAGKGAKGHRHRELREPVSDPRGQARLAQRPCPCNNTPARSPERSARNARCNSWRRPTNMPRRRPVPATPGPGVDSAAHAVWTLPFASSWEVGASMTATVVSDPSSATVVLDGEIDIATAPAIRRFLMAAINGGNVHLAVDMSGVTFIGAAGIGVLVAAANRAREAGGGLSLLAASRQVQRLLDIFHLDAILPAARRSAGPFVAGSAA
jgi:anti-anti-sigma factor